MKLRMVWTALCACFAFAVALQPGCRPTRVAGPGASSGADAKDEQRAEEAAEPADRQGGLASSGDEGELLLGQMCPEAARGRPAVRPVFALAGGWQTDEDVLARIIASGAARQLAVLGWDGRRLGVMSASGAASERGQPMLIGSYAGSPPCTVEAALGEEPERDAACLRATGGCGVAIGALEKPAGMGARPFGEDAELSDLETAGACVMGDALVVDLDGSGAASFSLAGISAGDPPTELVAEAGSAAGCEPSFALEATSGGVRVDVLAVADLDGSGRAEVLLGIGEGADRVWALYSARNSSGRLDRVAVARVGSEGSGAGAQED